MSVIEEREPARLNLREIQGAGESLLDVLTSLYPDLDEKDDAAVPLPGLESWENDGLHYPNPPRFDLPKTLSDHPSVCLFLDEIRQLRLLNARGREAKWREYMAGNCEALDEIHLSCLPMCIRIASAYAATADELLDLTHEGYLGLRAASRRYDPSLGASFLTYASFRVRNQVARAKAEAGLIHVPAHVQERAPKLRNTILSLFPESEPGVCLEGLASSGVVSETEACGIRALVPPLDVCGPMPDSRHRDPLLMWLDEGDNETVSTGDDWCGEESISDRLTDPLDVEALALLSEQRHNILAVLATLTPREQKVTKLYFGLDSDGDARTLEQVGETMGVTRERIRQILSKAVKRLRHPSRSRRIRP